MRENNEFTKMLFVELEDLNEILNVLNNKHEKASSVGNKNESDYLHNEMMIVCGQIEIVENLFRKMGISSIEQDDMKIQFNKERDGKIIKYYNYSEYDNAVSFYSAIDRLESFHTVYINHEHLPRKHYIILK